MAVEIITSFGQQCDSAGDPVSGAKIYVYNVGTTTARDIFSDTALVTPADNPIVCDAYGRHDMRYTATGSYTIVVKTSADVTIYTRDNIDGRVPLGAGALAIANGGTGETTAAAALTALGGATAAELADVAADVASLSGTLSSTEKTHIATGTTAQRPGTPVEGDIRRNTTTSRLEHYNGSSWEQLFTDTEIASQAQAQAGSVNTVVMTPSRTADAIGSLGGLKFISSQSASASATIDFTSFSTSYDAFMLVISNAKPATDDVEAWLRIGTGGGPTYQSGASDYSWFVGAGSRTQAQDTTDAQIVMTYQGATNSVGNASGESFNATLFFDNPDATNLFTVRGNMTYLNASGGVEGSIIGGGYVTAATAVTGIRFMFESGNIASGTFTLYGLRKA